MPVCAYLQPRTHEECRLKDRLCYRDKIERDTEAVGALLGRMADARIRISGRTVNREHPPNAASQVLEVHGKMATLCAVWYQDRGRHYPWRDSGDPYCVLVAEFLLRKTRVHRVLPVYNDFVSQYPTIAELAEADPAQVRDMVAPLGLPHRGPELVIIARSVVARGGTIDTGEGLLEFRGVGRYIANAVECLSFCRVAPLVDGGVGRLLRRVFDLNENKPAYADETLWMAARTIMETRPQECREVALGLIDLSSEFCKPRDPGCNECPLAGVCQHSRRASSVRSAHCQSSLKPLHRAGLHTPQPPQPQSAELYR